MDGQLSYHQKAYHELHNRVKEIGERYELDIIEIMGLIEMVKLDFRKSCEEQDNDDPANN